MHYVLAADGSGALTPVAATEFARDRAFGFGASRLAEYVEEKSVARGAGRATKAEEVHAITIETIRSGGPEAVAAQMLALPAAGRGAVVVCDALRPQDMAVVALGVMLAEQRGAFRRYSGDLGEI